MDINLNILHKVKFLMILIVKWKGLLTCPPAEEGKPYAISSTWKINPENAMSVSWRKDEASIGFCDFSLNCRNYLNDIYFVTMNRTSNDTLTSDVFIKNVSLSDEGLWRLIYIGLDSLELPEIFNCTLKVYARGKTEKCTHQMDSLYIYITCSVTRIYPAASCLYQKVKTETGIGNVTHSEHNSTKLHFEANCEISLPLSTLISSNNHYNISVTIYPNVTNTHDDVIYGSKQVISGVKALKANTNLSLENCPDEVEEDIQIECTCKSSLLSSDSVLWFNGPDVVYNEFNNVLTFTAKIKPRETFTCRLLSEKNITLDYVEFSPKVLQKGSIVPVRLYINGRFQKDSYVSVGYNTNVYVECVTYGFFAKVSCDKYFKDIDTGLSTLLLN
ncbi:polymorphic transmembrane cluster 2 transmembrane protein 2 [Biomphalaria pfeifferi]|uniref:Polymorphic transmembrane cluster 2 transmembrane protein 2 n=1 Tax=Biomphalaria pfeifferi TaxID=112525 RepID=A0AAD8C5L5_BIOPF|nr:polymorphic transmembrane cluster 2 transmembrane protein 2 [Biomphalaria pfeifferi]